MATKKYIYSGVGSPVANDVIPDTLTAHYLDTVSDDIWMHDGTDWKRIFVGGSEGSVASFSGYDAPDAAPTCPSIYVKWGGGDYKMYIAVFKNGEYWEWEELQLVTNMTP